MIRSILCAIFVLCAGSASAQEADIPIPAQGTPVQDWIDQHLDADGWTLLGVDGGGIALGGPDGVETLPDGTLRATVRQEYYMQRELGGVPMRSLLQTREVDCQRRMYRVTSMTVFERSNMRGASQTRANPNSSWSEGSPGSLYHVAMERICAAPAEGQPLG